MKTLKYLTICLVVCSLFTGSLFAQNCIVGMSINVEGELYARGSGVSAVVGQPGDDIYYTVTVSRAGLCALVNGEVDFYIPDGVAGDGSQMFDLADALAIDAGLSQSFTQDKDGNELMYTIEEVDLQTIDSPIGGTPDADEVRAYAEIEGDSVRDDGGGLQNGGAIQNYDTKLLVPCVEVLKEACGYSKVGDTILYDITITNCSDPAGLDTDVRLLSVDDSLLGPLSAPDILPAGEVFQILDVPYPVTGSDAPGPVVNTVTVTYIAYDSDNGVEVGAQADVTDNAEVELLNPALECSVNCVEDDIVDGQQRFTVDVCNTGDVELDVVHDVPGVPSPVTLEAGQCASDLVGTIEVLVPFVDNEATLTINALGTIPLCDLPNEITCTSTDTCTSCTPEFEVEKICDTNEDGEPDTECVLGGSTVSYLITVSNTNLDCDKDLIFVVYDEQAGIDGEILGPVAPGGSATIRGEEIAPVCVGGEEGDIPMDENEVCVEVFLTDGTPVGEDCDTATCCYKCEDPEGCTPGFWKNHPDCWCDSYVEGTLVSAVFDRLQSAPYDDLDDGDRKSDFDTDTLADSIRYRGGAELAGTVRNMLRHATAALLNGCSADVAYPLSDLAVIDLVNAALDSENIGIIQDAHTLLAGWNEDSPCPIDAHCNVIDVPNGD